MVIISKNTLSYRILFNKTYIHDDIFHTVSYDDSYVSVKCLECGKRHGIKVIIGDWNKLLIPSIQYCPHCGTRVRYAYDQENYLTLEEEF